MAILKCIFDNNPTPGYYRNDSVAVEMKYDSIDNNNFVKYFAFFQL